LAQNFSQLGLQVALRKSEDIVGEKLKIISQLNDELKKLKSLKPAVKVDAQTMT